MPIKKNQNFGKGGYVNGLRSVDRSVPPAPLPQSKKARKGKGLGLRNGGRIVC